MSAYPGSLDAAEATQKLKSFLAAGNLVNLLLLDRLFLQVLLHTYACNKKMNWYDSNLTAKN